MGVLKVKEGLGERVQLVLSQGTPLSPPPQVEEFLRIVMCAPIRHGYGMNSPCFTFYFCVSLLCLEEVVLFF